MLGMFGGAAFLAVYIAMVIMLGLPGLWVELTLARAAGTGPYRAFAKLGVPGGRFFGTLLVVVAVAAVSYYLVVIGWVLWFLIGSLSGAVMLGDPSELFAGVASNTVLQLALDVSVVAMCIGIAAGDVRRGIERVSKFFMPLVYAILAILAARSLTLPSALEGLEFYLRPRQEALTPMTLLAAMGQVFFSLGLGSTWIFVYGSYMEKRGSVVEAGTWTAVGAVSYTHLTLPTN